MADAYGGGGPSFPLILKEQLPAGMPERSNLSFGSDGGVGCVKFYVTIPVTDVGIIVLEQVIAIDREKEEVASRGGDMGEGASGEGA